MPISQSELGSRLTNFSVEWLSFSRALEPEAQPQVVRNTISPPKRVTTLEAVVLQLWSLVFVLILPVYWIVGFFGSAVTCSSPSTRDVVHTRRKEDREEGIWCSGSPSCIWIPIPFCDSPESISGELPTYAEDEKDEQSE